MSGGFGVWLKKNSFPIEEGVYQQAGLKEPMKVVSVQALAEEVAGMSRAKMAIMRTVCRNMIVKKEAGK